MSDSSRSAMVVDDGDVVAAFTTAGDLKLMVTAADAVAVGMRKAN